MNPKFDPKFELSGDGGVDSEKTYVKQLVQKYVRKDEDEDNDRLFDGETTESDIPEF